MPFGKKTVYGRLVANYTVYGLMETRLDHRYHGRIRYVGQTKNLVNRIYDYRTGQGCNRRMTYWLKQCPNFKVIVLTTCNTLEEAWAAEILYIARERTFNSKHGLNYRDGGTGGDMLSDESKRQISESLKKHYADPTARARMSAAVKKLYQDPEWAAARTAQRKAWAADPEHRRLISERTKAAMARPEVRARVSAGQKRRHAAKGVVTSGN